MCSASTASASNMWHKSSPIHILLALLQINSSTDTFFDIKWICPSAPTRQVTLFGGYPCTAWFNVTSLSEDASDDLEGLDASATHVANLLATEPDDVKLGVAGFSMGASVALHSATFKLGVAGFSMGASVALHSATCRALGQYGNGNRYPINLSAVLALSGWLPCSRNLRNRVGASQEAARRAASLPMLLCHGQVDDVVEHKLGEKSAQTMYSAGFQNLTFRSYNGLGHYTNIEEINDVCRWLMIYLGA
ncbi:Phospholipase/carboxylesterase/thioesterase [Artemisia annua]|uniref:Phospholipase/carboxylesterase/thioesterase n=1 Tax=Artemisia annua TaxID=35608 RepID=A0A2U1MM95_ARTAN|nr:Phospholipase/carboxylesterase/thioesterase [Artemisia annua]